MVSICFGLSGKTTEVLGAYLLPFAGIDVGFGLLPGGDEVYHFVYTTLVAEVHLVDEGASALHLVGPGNVVEPKDELFGTGSQIIV